jgi:hypothetical protein
MLEPGYDGGQHDHDGLHQEADAGAAKRGHELILPVRPAGERTDAFRPRGNFDPVGLGRTAAAETAPGHWIAERIEAVARNALHRPGELDVE